MGLITFNERTNTFNIEMPGGSKYSIHMSQIYTEAQLCDWVVHLSEKYWAINILRDFVTVVRGVWAARRAEPASRIEH